METNFSWVLGFINIVGLCYAILWFVHKLTKINAKCDDLIQKYDRLLSILSEWQKKS